MKLRYYDPEPSYGGDAYYAGNISEWWWQHKNVNGNYDADNNTYIYHYDDLSRLNDSRLTYNESEDIADEFAERGITYDKNSNILTLNRSSLSPGDARNYRFSYDGNQRNRELESNLAYGYDANGNMGYDPVGDLFISYNLLNLPSMIRGEYDRRIYYRYLADGTKLSMGSSTSTATQRYIGSLVYDNGKFESSSFGGGRLVSEGNTTAAHYFLTDHLGSTRVVAKVTSTGREDLDRKDYYPFGKAWKQPELPTSGNRYTFSGKEQQRVGLATTKLLDFGARFYDPDGVTFMQQDPLLEKYYSIGQYNYCAGNPIIHIDIDGKYIGDPVKDPQIRMNRASNLYGKDIRMSSNGTYRSHQGFDYYAPEGTEIMAVQDGTVVQSGGNHKDYGVTITIEHTTEDGNTVYSFYAHLSEANVKEGSLVKEGETIGKSGVTGNASDFKGKDQHLHFEARTQKENASGLTGKMDPNEIVDTKFVSQDPNRKLQNQVGVIKISPDGKEEKMNLIR